MKKIIVTLKQHTPMIHFQHYQENATLRASEVKPKLDRYILEQINDEERIALEKDKAITPKKSLNYKMRITPLGENLMKLKVNKKEDIYDTEDFPLLLSNIGGKKDKNSLTNFSMYKFIIIRIQTPSENLYKILYKIIPEFIMNNNFGQRSNKGFGSFTIKSITDNEQKTKHINCFSSMKKGDVFFEFPIENDAYSIDTQKKIFRIIEIIWKKIKQSCQSITNNTISDLPSYIAGMNILTLDRQLQRMPSPIIFKPVVFTESEDSDKSTVYVYILNNNKLISQLESDYPQITHRLNNHVNINTCHINDIVPIYDIVYNLIDDNDEQDCITIYIDKKPITLELYENQ